MPRRPSSAALAAVLLTAPLARAQCEGWFEGESATGTSGRVNALAVHDPDGAGPAEPVTILGGSFIKAGGLLANRIAAWDGRHFTSLGSGMNEQVWCVASCDAPFFASPQVIAGGSFTTAGAGSAARIARWDGAAWHPLGAGMNQFVLALATFDADGPGPQPAGLIAGGEFTAAAGTPAYLARWDGQAWHPLGAGVNAAARALTLHDHDGSPLTPAHLIVGGSFASAGGAPAFSIARWDGQAWFPLGSGILAFPAVRALASYDPPGPSPAVLVAAGSFAFAGGVPAQNIAQWDGASWQPLGTGTTSAVFALTTFEPPGRAPELIVGGAFFSAGGLSAVSYVARWDGAAWDRMDTGLQSDVRALAAYDADGPGELPPRVIAGGDFFSAGPNLVQHIAAWDDSAWSHMGAGFSALITAAALVEPDEPGGSPAVCVGGTFSTHNGTAMRSVARWDGADWHALGPGLSSAPSEIITFDFDGPGPEAPQIVAGGGFSTPPSRVARWDGAAWHAVGANLDGSIYTVMSCDRDGPGPLPAELFAGGYAVLTGGGAPWTYVARWDGAAWQPFGGVFTSEVYALAPFDPDGAGPAHATPIAGGNFISCGGVSTWKIAQWNGAAWEAMGEGIPTGWVTALTSWDSDGAGPAAPQLIAGGLSSGSANPPINYIARWDGASWLPLGSGVDKTVTALTTFDADGTGPQQSLLVAFGVFTSASGVPARGVATWNGVTWAALGDGLGDGGAAAALTFDPDGAGPVAPQLVAAGDFGTAGGAPSAWFARWGIAGAPAITSHPVPTQVSVSQVAPFSVAAAPATQFQWRRNAVPLADGPTPGGSILSGTTTALLEIQNTQAPDAGAYDCVVGNRCGITISSAADLTVLCYADCNLDAALTIADFACFQSKFAAADPWADCNQTGTLTIADFACFQSKFATGCP